jgi:C-lobe and N-lobe beta barrels of Tf-binding protein B
MRMILLLAGTAMLSACGGAGGSLASAGLPTQSPSTNTSGTGSTHTFVAPTEVKTYVALGGSQVLEYSIDERGKPGTPVPPATTAPYLGVNQYATLFAPSPTTVRGAGASITYDPRSAVYTLSVKDPLSGAAVDTRFQDPASRTDFGGLKEPQWGTPNLVNPNLQYLQAGDGNPLSPYSSSGTGALNTGDNANAPVGEKDSSYQSTTMFVLKPGSETKYVTYAGYLRNSMKWVIVKVNGVDTLQGNFHLERGAFAFGELTANANVPTTGTGSYTGSMLASVLFNPTLDGQDQSGPQKLGNYFQWISGTSKVDVDFAKALFTLNLAGTVTAPHFDYWTDPVTKDTVLKAGATFAATGNGSINMVNFGGFKGAFTSAAFQNPAGGSQYTVAIAGSSIDGAFYGPNGEEVGGGFNVTGGNPDERINIIGAFTGKK